MENFKMYEKKSNPILRKFKKVLTIAALCMALTACKKTNNTTEKEPTGIETITPTDTINPSVTNTPEVTVTPTNTPTPEPTSTPTPIPTPSIKPSEIKVNVYDLMNRENIFNDYFGEEEDPETEIAKRKEYAASFGILSQKQIDDIVLDLNVLFLLDEKTDSIVAEKYLRGYNKNTIEAAGQIIDKITEYNLEHPDNQFVISWLAIGNALNEYDRIRFNNFQLYSYRMMKEDVIYAGKITISAPFVCYINEKDGTSTNVTFGLSDISNVCKCYSLFVPRYCFVKLDKNGKLPDNCHNILTNINILPNNLIEEKLIDLEEIKFSSKHY